MMEPAGLGASMPRAFLHVGGITLARHQLGLALAMNCQRIVCLAREIGPELIALQHEAEKGGAHFHIVSGPRALAGLITANDDLLGLSEGLLADPNEAKALLDAGHAVLVQPVETGIAAGYERIDLNHATAGAFRIPGRLVERLVELPPDCDALSALTRIGLQAGIPMQEVPAFARDGARWQLIRDEGEAHVTEIAWLRLHMGDRGTPTPVTLLSRVALRALGPSLLHAGNGGTVARVAALGALLIGLGAAWFGFVIVALVFLALSAVSCETATVLRRIERSSLGELDSPVSIEFALGVLLDLTLIALVVWSLPLAPWESVWQRAFAPLMLIMLVRLLPRLFDRTLSPWIEDRTLLALLLAIAAGFGYLLGAVELLAVLLALSGLLFPGSKPRLT